MQRLIQLALDLWERSTPVAPRLAPVPPAVVEEVQPLASVLLPQSFEHPQASRAILVGDVHIGYALQRVQRKTIGFVVDDAGLTVRAPRWVSQAGIEEAVRDKAPWIVRKLGDMQKRHAYRQQATIQWRHGGVLPFLGQSMELVLDGELRHARAGAMGRVEEAKDGHPAVARLYLPLPRDASRSQIRDMAQAWFMRSARQHFLARLAHFEPRLGVRHTSMRLTNAATRWGSAKTDGSIRLNWRLMHYSPEIIDYVVAHELAHLRVMDHSPRFWNTVAEVVPDHRELRRQLKETPAPPWDD
ncbi:hypothetical protein GCM10027082_02720 [Comamonas humi]